MFPRGTMGKQPEVYIDRIYFEYLDLMLPKLSKFPVLCPNGEWIPVVSGEFLKN
jgi:hypothetical protein